MFLQRVRLSNFRCFGPNPVDITLDGDVTALVGANGSGKTAALIALQRMFGTSSDARLVRRSDFHVPVDETEAPNSRELYVEAIFDFPELAEGEGGSPAVPQFFQQMVIDADGRMVVRMRLNATWTDDGSVDGAVTPELLVLSSLDETYTDDDVSVVAPHDRARVQMIYVPPAREAGRNLTQFLRGRLWRAARWSTEIRASVDQAGTALDSAFTNEPAVKSMTGALEQRWSELHSVGTDSVPHFRALDREFSEVVGRVGLYFEPSATGGERRADELSDGQQSLLQLAMTAATLDVENALLAGDLEGQFETEEMALPALTIVAVEEPENSLSPFYLGRIMSQLRAVSTSTRAQAVLSTHSPSALRRIDPRAVRFFRLNNASGHSSVRSLTLPTDVEEEEKYVREAVRAYPEIYFARAVVLGEGASEQVVLPILAAARGMAIDQSFVAVVPLGGRHVNHMWRLLHDLGIPHFTLIDLDRGRAGGTGGRLKTTIAELIANGVDPETLFQPGTDVASALAAFGALPSTVDLAEWITTLRGKNVFFAEPLDLDWSMLSNLPDAYMTVEDGMTGPSDAGEPMTSVLGVGGSTDYYNDPLDADRMKWYRYLFLNRGKPSTHLRVLSRMSDEALAQGTPPELTALLDAVNEVLK